MEKTEPYTNQDKGHDPDNGRAPRAGDVISAFYVWGQDVEDNIGKKLRPCVIIKVASDASSIVVAPISTKGLSAARDMLEIPEENRRVAGLDPERRSWIKLTEVNRIDLPTTAVLPRETRDGQMSWRRGMIDAETLRKVQTEIGYRIADKTLTGHRIRAAQTNQISIASARVIPGSRETSQVLPASPHAVQDADDRLARVRQKAREKVARMQAEAEVKAAPRMRESAEVLR